MIKLNYNQICIVNELFNDGNNYDKDKCLIKLSEFIIESDDEIINDLLELLGILKISSENQIVNMLSKLPLDEIGADWYGITQIAL
ncbi:MAG: hypothetical protein RR835_02800 [Peptostreptococcaceae bacterium]